MSTRELDIKDEEFEERRRILLGEYKKDCEEEIKMYKIIQ